MTTLRGSVKFKEDLVLIFSHLKKNPTTGEWDVRPFEGKIQGRTQRIDNKRALAKYFGIGKDKLYQIIAQNPNGIQQQNKPKTVQPETARAYQETLAYTQIRNHYSRYINPKTGALTGQGGAIQTMGENLFYMFKRDPMTLTYEQCLTAIKDPRFKDANGQIKFTDLSQIRMVMTIASRLKDVPVPLTGFTFSKGDPFYTKGLKSKGLKLEDYLQEPELLKFVPKLEAIDVLVMHRLGLEGGGRISSTSMVSKEKILFDMNTIVMYEPKVKETVRRIFVDETLDFVNMYIRDRGIIGRLFQRHESKGKNYQSFNGSIRRAGLDAGLWRYQTDEKGKYKFILKQARKIGGGGALGHQKVFLTEGKVTTSHTTMKHTFVSLASQHGFSLDDCGRQCGTDPTTLRQYYHGGAEGSLMAVVLGKRNFEPWMDWIKRVIHPLYMKRYNELKAQGKWTISSEQLKAESRALSNKEEDI